MARYGYVLWVWMARATQIAQCTKMLENEPFYKFMVGLNNYMMFVEEYLAKS